MGFGPIGEVHVHYNLIQKLIYKIDSLHSSANEYSSLFSLGIEDNLRSK